MNDLIGKRFNKLIILKRDYGHKKMKFLCRCDCGKEKIIRKDHLLSNSTKSCGCSSAESRRTTLKKRNYISPLFRSDNYGAKSTLFKRYVWQIKNKIPINTITLEEFIIVATGNCDYCGKGPDKLVRNGNHRSQLLYTGVDRKDSNKGYNPDNVVTCCTSCNIIKNNLLTYEEMKVAMNAILEYRKGDSIEVTHIVGERIFMDYNPEGKKC